MTFSPEQWPAPVTRPPKDVEVYLTGADRAQRIDAAVRRFGQRVLTAACDPSKSPWGSFGGTLCTNSDISVHDITGGYKPQKGALCWFRSNRTSAGSVEADVNVNQDGSFSTTFSQIQISPASIKSPCPGVADLQIRRVRGLQWDVTELVPDPLKDPQDRELEVPIDSEDTHTISQAQALDQQALACLDAFSR